MNANGGWIASSAVDTAAGASPAGSRPGYLPPCPLATLGRLPVGKRPDARRIGLRSQTTLGETIENYQLHTFQFAVGVRVGSLELCDWNPLGQLVIHDIIAVVI